MTSYQRTVLWIGLIIVALNLVSKWPGIKSIVFNGAGLSTTTTAPKAAAPQGAGQNGGIQPTPQPNPSPTPQATQVV